MTTHDNDNSNDNNFNDNADDQVSANSDSSAGDSTADSAPDFTEEFAQPDGGGLSDSGERADSDDRADLDDRADSDDRADDFADAEGDRNGSGADSDRAGDHGGGSQADGSDLPHLLKNVSRLLRREFVAAAASADIDPREMMRMRRDRRWNADESGASPVAEGPARSGETANADEQVNPDAPHTAGKADWKRRWTESTGSDERAHLWEGLQTIRDRVGAKVEDVLTSEEADSLAASLEKIIDRLGGGEFASEGRPFGRHGFPGGRGEGQNHRETCDHEHGRSHEHSRNHENGRGRGRDRGHGTGRGFDPRFRGGPDVGFGDERDRGPFGDGRGLNFGERRGPGFGRRGGRGRGDGSSRGDSFGRGDGSSREGGSGRGDDGRGRMAEAAFERGFAAGFKHGVRS